MSSHDIDVKTIGESLQFVEVELDPDETVIAEAGAVVYLEDGITYEVKMGDGSNTSKGFLAGLNRMVTGESLFLTHFTNTSNQKRKVAFSGNYPGSTVTVDLGKLNRGLICQRDAFLCGAYGTNIAMEFTKKLGAGFFGGEGFILQKLQGDGKATLHAGGKIIKKKLNGEKIRIDAGCLVAFTEGLDYNIEAAGNLTSMLFGGEGMFFATLSGSGTVLIQSVPISKMANAIASHSGPSNSGDKRIAGGLSDVLDRI